MFLNSWLFSRNKICFHMVKMFRPDCKWITTCRQAMSQFGCTQNARFFCVQNTENTTAKRKSGNQIKIIGRVQNQVLSMADGYDSFHVKTATKSIQNLVGVTHNIKAKRGEIEIPKLTDWDLVYVTGEIQYLRYPNGKSFVSIPHVSAKKVIRMENENECDDLEHLEKECLNEVKLVGAIGGEISDEKATIFSVVTNTNVPKTSTTYGDWHRILVLDGSLRDYVRNNLKVSDRIVLNGEIIYHKIDLEDGNVATQSVILAKRIQKVIKFTKNDQVEPQTPTQTIAEQ